VTLEVILEEKKELYSKIHAVTRKVGL